jgi:hypothetical protein
MGYIYSQLLQLTLCLMMGYTPALVFRQVIYPISKALITEKKFLASLQLVEGDERLIICVQHSCYPLFERELIAR